ncbi:MAG: aminotransferase class I/II-fold pyridoxal phosphate-dependent enzyme, partial [Deferribacterales bacterium]
FLEDFLQKNRDKYENVFIVTESLFSMDGDFADIKRIVEIKKRYDCFVYLDEAHSIGVYGEGRGLAYEVGCLDDIDIFVGTFGKSFSSVGGFVSTNDIFYDLIINYCRTLIFTTALPPVVINWNLFILNEMSRFNEKRRKLFENSNKLRNRIKELNLQTSGESYIIPIIIGDSKETITLFSYLKGKGILTSAVRPPTVPIGTARIRLSLNPLVDDEDIHIFIEALNLWRGKYEN